MNEPADVHPNDAVNRPSVDPDRAAERRRLHFHEVPEGGEDPISVGEELKAARQRVGEDIRTVAAALKIKRDHLEALEEGLTDRLPARAYAVGFVRSYAEYLGLDSNALVARFKDEIGSALPPPVLAETTVHDELGLTEAQDDSRLPQGWILLFVMLMALTLWGAFYLSQSADHLLATQNDAPLVPTGPQSLETDDAKAPAVTTADPALATIPTQRVPPKAQAAESAAAAAPAPAERRVTAEIVGTRVALKGLSRGVFVRVEDTQTGEALFSGRLNKGDIVRVPDRRQIILVTRNAGGVALLYDGQDLGAVGPRGTVLTSYPLSIKAVGARARAKEAARAAAEKAAEPGTTLRGPALGPGETPAPR